MEALLREARGWVADCFGDEVDLISGVTVGDLSDGEIIAGVDCHYAGGWDGFVADAAGLL